MKKLAVYGAGGLGRETALLIEQINHARPSFKMVGFFDDGMAVGTVVDKWKVLGGLQQLNESVTAFDVILAIADTSVRKSVVQKIISPKVNFPTLIHPTCIQGDERNHFGKGCILTAGVILTTGIHLGDFVIVNLSTTIGHDVVLGKFSTVMPGCNISGNVRIGEGCLIGTGAKILQNLSIGKQCNVGAGAVVTHNFPDGKTIIGIPAHEK